MPPPWTRRACLIALVVGLVLVVVGPMLVYQLALVSAEAPPPGEGAQLAERQQAIEASLQRWRGRFLWIMPVGMGLVFSGGIGLLFVWVTKLAEQAGANSS